MSKALKNKVKLNDVVSVKDFGAVGDGVTNDTTALLNFYNYCISTGLSGHIVAGTYKVTTGVLVFDNGFTDKTWPHIYTDGNQATIFQIDSATETNEPVLTWKNGTASSGVGKYWRGGSHGGLTINGSGTGAAMTSQHHISLTGTWGIKFGWMASNNCKGSSFHCPQNLYGGTNPDPYANSFLHFDGLESNYAAGYGFYNGNYVGMTNWTVENVRIIQPSLGGWFGIGSGNIINNWSVGNVTGWAFDDGTYTAATGGSPQRNYIEIAELDNCQYGIRLNKSSRTRFIGVRFVTRYQTSPNASAVYWPITGVDLAGGTSPSVGNVDLDVQWRIEAGGLVGNLGTTINANNSGNISNVNVNFDYLDNAGFGLTDAQMMGTGYRQNAPVLVSRNSRALYDSRDKAFSFARGSAATTSVPNTGMFSSAAKIAFTTQIAGFKSTSSIYNTTTSTFTCPRDGWYRFEVAIPLSLTVGTRVRLGLFDGTNTYGLSTAYHAVAGIQVYSLNYTYYFPAGTSLYVICDQNSGTASVAASVTIENTEVRFVVQEV